MQTSITFSEKAANKVKRLIEDEGDPSLCLRVFISGGGCNGFSYGFTFDDTRAEDDAVSDSSTIPWRGGEVGETGQQQGQPEGAVG